MRVSNARLILSIGTACLALSMGATAQESDLVDAPLPAVNEKMAPRLEAVYSRPTQRERIENYAWDTFGPLPIVTAGFTSAVGQWTNSTPEWGQGAEGYGKRLGSDFGMAATTTTTRFALSEVLHEDSLYYRCHCRGFFRRLNHAVLSTVTARHGQDGQRTFSLSALVAPYAGSTVAVYGWYPDRYGAKDSFRIGNYNLLGLVGGNIAMEFLYSAPHSLLSRVRLNSRRAAPDYGVDH